jgi:hypothetical protein
MRLQTVFHLQTVFDAAQKSVCVGEFGQFGFGQKIAVGETNKTYQSVRHAQPFVAPAVRELESLRDKFDLADAARAEFYVETVFGDFI